MYKKILTAVNEHLNSEVTARYAMNLARVSGARLYLCFVAEKEMTASTINRAKEAVKRIFFEAEKIGVGIEALIETGDPVKKVGELVRGERIDIVFADTAVVSGSGRAVSFATGMQTEFGSIAHLTGAVEAGLSPLQKEIVKATRVIAVIAAVVGVLFFYSGF